jgi:CHAD domain-containing protein
VRAALVDHRRTAHEELSAVLTSERTTALLDGWRRWLADLEVEPGQGPPLAEVVTARIAKAQRKVLRDGRAIDDTTEPQRLHDLRKDAKRLRYLLECFGSLFPPKGHRAFVAQLKALQENLGDHQDAEVQLEELRSLAHDLHDVVDTDVLLAMGRLGDHLERRRQRARDEFAGRFQAYDTAANRQALDQLLGAGSGP